MFSYIFVILSASSMIGAAPADRDLITRMGLASQKIFGAQDEPGAIDIILDRQDTDGTFEAKVSDDHPKKKSYSHHDEDSGYVPDFPYKDYASPKAKTKSSKKHSGVKAKEHAYSSEKGYDGEPCHYHCDTIDE
ncbi:hypothetical protein DSO57_1011235 [Entomophthora muscae]|uniref:Uncharacterized protein n=1 Tax=Entomophthora muscae TaxID=34485 RepID=A0ACC2S8N2_9FUNG|nr:hypothetical protein DSO57_1011235 [Entomophthora muscae]